MRLSLEATPQELEEKSGDLIKAVAEIIEPVDPDMSEALTKALPRKEPVLKYPVLRELQRRTQAAYEVMLDAMLKDIGKVLDQTVEKGGEDSDLFKALTHKYIRRVPKPGGGYRYYYRESAAARAARAGEEIRLGAGMVKIVEVTEDGTVTLEEDGKRRSVKPNEWADLMARHYGDSYYAHAERRARQAIKAVLRHVPRELLKDLRGNTDVERFADLKKRVPDVYRRLEVAFQRAGVDPFRAKQIIAHSLERKNWKPEARALVIGAVLTPEGVKLATHHRQIVAGAENLAGGEIVQAKHVAAVIDLRVGTRIEDVARRAEADLARLETLLSRARGEGTDAKVAAVLANALAFTSESLQKLSAYSTAFPGADDRVVVPAREALLEVQGVVTTRGASTSVFVAGEGGRPKALKAQYRLMEAGDVIASHTPPSFRPNEDYPSDVQERAYHRDKEEQLKVLRNAKRMAAEFVVNTNPDAVNGPPIITEDGIVLGGNSRTMSMQIIYDEHPDKAAELRKYLADHAHEVGLSKADVAAMSRPVLVRVVEVEDTSTKNLQLLVRQMNETFTQAMDPRTMQVAMGRRLSQDALKSLGDAMKEDETLNAFLTSKSAEPFISALYRSGIIDERNTNQYIKRGTRKLNSDGVTLVSRILVGRMIEDADLLSETRPDLLNSVAQSVPAMMLAAGSGEGYDLSDELRIAMNAVNRLEDMVEAGTIKALSSKMSTREVKALIDNYFSDMFGDRHPVLDNPRAQTMVEVFIRRPGKTMMAKVFREYAKMAAANPEGQKQLVGERYTPEQVFRFSVRAAIDKDAAEEKATAESAGPELSLLAASLAALDVEDPDYLRKDEKLDLSKSDHTKAIADHDAIAYERIKQVLVGKRYLESDFLEGGPLYGWSTNRLIDLVRDKRVG